MISIYELQNISPYCLIKQVNKILGIRNSEIWLFDDVSKIFIFVYILQGKIAKTEKKEKKITQLKWPK